MAVEESPILRAAVTGDVETLEVCVVVLAF